MESSGIATVDVGTNTALMLISGWGAGQLVIQHDETRFVRLGEGVDAAGRINDGALHRLCDTLAYYQDVARERGVRTMIVAATSASRDAQNRQAVIEIVRKETGLAYEILTGEQEAFWSFRGALSGMKPSEQTYLVVDIGGGSTELVRGAVSSQGASIHHAISLNMGSVRLMERFFQNQPPDPKDVAAARKWIQSQLEAVPAADPGAVRLVGASGTTTALAMLEERWEAIPIDRPLAGNPLSLVAVRRWEDRLLSLTRDQVLALNPAAMTGRSDVFPTGILILTSIMDVLGFDEVSVSPRGLRHGLALRCRENESGGKSTAQ
jgi:exopolyphosphatase/guanosine-5'-triphosphate,3'-diphosphate pyrophosphatase